MSAPVSNKPYVLLGLMTLFSFAGPFLILYTLRGGVHADWPPDRPIEWAVFGLITGGVVVLMVACLSVGRLFRQGSDRADHSGDRS